MPDDFFESILNEFSSTKNAVESLSPLVLAYVGDAVYEVFIRTMIVCEGNAPVHKMHKRSVAYVKAQTQSDAVHKIMDFLTPIEQDVVRRGRNAKSGTIPKNADVTEYKYATGFESLIGYLYLKKDFQRLIQIIKMAISKNVDQGKD